MVGKWCNCRTRLYPADCSSVWPRRAESGARKERPCPYVIAFCNESSPFISLERSFHYWVNERSDSKCSWQGTSRPCGTSNRSNIFARKMLHFLPLFPSRLPGGRLCLGLRSEGLCRVLRLLVACLAWCAAIIGPSTERLFSCCVDLDSLLVHYNCRR